MSFLPLLHHTQQDAMLSRLMPLLLLCLTSIVQARYVCNPTSASDSYPFCIHIPDAMPADNCQGTLPFILYLPGSGAKGVGTDVYTHVGVLGKYKL